MIMTRIIAAMIAVMILDASPKIMTVNAKKIRGDNNLFMDKIDFSNGVCAHLVTKPANKTAIVILIGSTNAFSIKCPFIMPLIKAAAIPITNKNTSKLCSTFFTEKGNNKTKIRIIINPIIIFSHQILYVLFFKNIFLV